MISLDMVNSSSKLELNDLEMLEESINMKLPSEYKKFLIQYNGGTPDKSRFSTKDGKVKSIVAKFLSLDSSKEDNLIDEISGFTEAGQIPSNLIPVATTPADNRVLLSINGVDSGYVYYWAWDEEPAEASCSYTYMRLIANSFDEFLSILHL